MKKMPKLKFAFKLLLSRGQKGGSHGLCGDMYKTVGSAFQGITAPNNTRNKVQRLTMFPTTRGLLQLHLKTGTLCR